MLAQEGALPEEGGSHTAWICWPPNAHPNLSRAGRKQAEVLT